MAVATLREQLRQRRFNQRMADAIDAERRGQPIAPEIAHRMTKPKVREPLFQVFVDFKGERRSRAASPKAGKEFCERILETINGRICLGQIKGIGNARIEPVIAI